MNLHHFSKTVKGPVRVANEDSIGNITLPNNLNINLYIVCDGMGGHEGGAKASTIAVNAIQEYFSNTPNPVPQIALNESICFANMQIFGAALAEPEFKGMGTTCVVMLESEGLIYIAHVGDSRIYLNTDQKLYRITKDHSYVQDLVDKGEITDQQMETHPNKNKLTRALGISADVEVEVASKPILAKTGDSFLLCSDGLNGLINDRMINSVINTNDLIETKCLNLIAMAESAGGYDNISVDLIEVLLSSHTKTQFINKNNVDLIDTKTQNIVIDKDVESNKPTNSSINKYIFTFITLGILITGIFLYNKHQPLPSIIPDEIVLDPVIKIDTIIKVNGTQRGLSGLTDDLYDEVEALGIEYCNDCPVFYNSKLKAKISIHEFRDLNKVKYSLLVEDYLMIEIKNSNVLMPLINKKIKEDTSIQVFSDETLKQKKQNEDKLNEELITAKDDELKVEKSVETVVPDTSSLKNKKPKDTEQLQKLQNTINLKNDTIDLIKVKIIDKDSLNLESAETKNDTLNLKIK